VSRVDRYLAILGLGPDATIAELRTAYRGLAKRNHPDLFPDEQRARKQLRMMRVNEAYMLALAGLAERDGAARADGDTERAGDAERAGADGRGPVGREPGRRETPRPASDGGRADRAATEEAFSGAWAVKARPGAPSGSRTVGFPRDPAYVYYKQGFRYYNLGATELFRKEASKVRRSLMTEGTADGYILRLALRALHYFERSCSYFLVVVERYPASPWAADARWKLRRLEKFSSVYQRICENLSRRSSTRRSSFSIVSGADPS